MSAGYSNRSLVAKLGIKPGFRLLLLNTPPGYFDRLRALPEGATCDDSRSGLYDFIHLFIRERAILEAEFAALAALLKPDGMLWISWPKRASKQVTNLNENIVRDIGLACGLVDVKVAAVDEIWSGLKFVIRLKDRPRS